MSFQAQVKGPDGNLVTTGLPILVRAQYLGWDGGGSRWCAIYEEAFSVDIVNGRMLLRLGNGTLLSSAATAVGPHSGVVSELVSGVPTATNLNSMVNLSQITWATRCLPGASPISSALGAWSPEAGPVNLTAGGRALRLYVSLPGGVNLTPGFNLESLPYSYSSNRADQLTGSMGATEGQVLKWLSGAWTPAADSGVTYTQGPGIVIAGTELRGAAHGAAGTYGSATEIPIITINADGHITSVTEIAASGGGALGADSVATANIQNLAVTDAKIAGVDWSKISNRPNIANGVLASGQIYIGNVSDVATATTMTGDATLASSGALSLASVATPGTYTKVTVDAKGRVTSGAGLLAADLPAINVTDLTSTSGILPVARGGTGSATGSITGTGALAFAAGGTNENVSLTPSGTGSVVVSNKLGIATGATPRAHTALDVVGVAAGRTQIIASGATVDLSVSNTHLLKAVGGDTITLQNLVDGGVYTLVISDVTSRTYAFAGCTNSLFSPASEPTDGQSAFTIMAIVDGGDTNCYISWVTGFN